MMENGRDTIRDARDAQPTPQTPEILITTAAGLVMTLIVYLTLFDGHAFF